MIRFRSIGFRFDYHLLLMICWLTIFPLSAFAQVGKTEKLASPLLQTQTFQLRRQLAQRISVYQLQTPLNQVFDELSRRYGVPIWLDRRIDKSALMDVEFSDITLAELIAHITQTNNLSFAFIEGWLYVAPGNLAEKIEAAYWTGFQWANFNAPQLLSPTGLESREGLVSVEALFSELTSTDQISCNNANNLPADVWESVSFRETSYLAALHLLLAGFGLEPGFSNRSNKRVSFTIGPISNRETVDAIYKSIDLDLTKGKHWKENWPDTIIKKSKNHRIALRGPIGAHKDLLPIAKPLKDKSRSRQSSSDTNKQSISKTALSGTLQGNLAEVLGALRAQLKLTINPWPLANDIAEKRVTLQLDETQIDALLRMISTQVDIPISRSGLTVNLDIEFLKGKN